MIMATSTAKNIMITEELVMLNQWIWLSTGPVV